MLPCPGHGHAPMGKHRVWCGEDRQQLGGALEELWRRLEVPPHTLHPRFPRVRCLVLLGGMQQCGQISPTLLHQQSLTSQPPPLTCAMSAASSCSQHAAMRPDIPPIRHPHLLRVCLLDGVQQCGRGAPAIPHTPSLAVPSPHPPSRLTCAVSATSSCSAACSSAAAATSALALAASGLPGGDSSGGGGAPGRQCDGAWSSSTTGSASASSMRVADTGAEAEADSSAANLRRPTAWWPQVAATKPEGGGLFL